ncbi:MAG: MFS transporter [Bdellovibrio sp. 28-41-41]|nr:MAG: MFS transporter [Bdellovibrio sp. 28-41-41]
MSATNSDIVPKIGLKENWYQFTLLVIVNAFVGAMIGLERSILPQIAEKEFSLAVKTAILSFIVVFGFTKAFTNYFAGLWSDQLGRKKVLVVGWLFAIPVPFLLMWAPNWTWILVANFFLGISQGLTWSTTVIMKIDLVGSKHRGLAMGFNEFAGYLAVALSALLTGYIASNYGLRPEPFYLGVVYVVVGLSMSLLMIKETKGHVDYEIASKSKSASDFEKPLTQKEIFYRTTLKDKNLSSVTQAGFVNNLNDGMAWGLFPILYAVHGMNLEMIGWLAAIYPATWGLCQLWTGHLSDSIGRKSLIVWGMWVQSIGIVITMTSIEFVGFALGGIFLGIGTAMVYPTLLAAIGDVAHPSWRASSVGVYRFWRDSGYAIGAIISGIVADFFGITTSIGLVAVITFFSGVLVLARMKETLQGKVKL